MQFFVRNNTLMRILIRGSIFLVGLCLLGLGFSFWKGWRTLEKIQYSNPAAQTTRVEPSDTEPSTVLRGETEGRINILLLGRAGETYPGKNLTDTIMIASIDTKEKRVGFFSLPRDLYVPIPHTTLFTKLNSLYQYGLSNNQGITTVQSTIEFITGQPIQYFITLDFDSFERIIDTLGGIRVENSRDIHDTRYPGKHYSYETFDLPAGWHTLDGMTALKYVRERHDDPEGDFGRAKRQQQVLSAVREKAFSFSTFLNPITINNVLNVLGEGVTTNITPSEIARFAALLKTIDTHNLSTIVIDAWQKESLLRVSHVQVGPIAAFILVPRTGNWGEIRRAAAELFDENARATRIAQLTQEHARVVIVAQPQHATAAHTFQRLLQDTYPFASVTTVLDTNTPDDAQAHIQDMTNHAKLYTLDELIRAYNLTPSSNTTLPQVKHSTTDTPVDFFLFFGDNLKDTLTEQSTLKDTPDTTETGFSEYFEPQPLIP